MTTSHKPTYHPAIGSAFSGGFRFHAPRRQQAVGALNAHTKLKIRQIGQNAPEELAVRDVKAELEERERQHYDKINLERKRQGLLPYAEQKHTPSAITDGTRKRPRDEKEKEKESEADADAEPETTQADEDGDGDGDEEQAPAPVDLASAMKQVDWSKIDDADDSDAGGDEDDEDDDEDEEAELRRELEKIKKEREEERIRKEAEEAADRAGTEEEQAMRGNPLLLQDTFGAARRWDEDVVFRNQSRGEIKHKKRFVNDTIRSDFHRNFLRKYVQ